MRYSTVILLFIFGTVSFLFYVKPYLHGLQLSGYKTSGIFKSKTFLPCLALQVGISVAFVVIWILYFFVLHREIWGLIITAAYGLTCLLVIINASGKKAKKPLRYTKRMIRFIVAVQFIYTAIMFVGLGAMFINGVETYFLLLYTFISPLIFLPLTAFANIVTTPFEKLNNKRYIKKAKKVFADSDGLIKIAITGSYGKTSVKNYLEAMLKSKYSVLSTKASFNTPMGMAYTADEYAGQDVLIAEFGARHTGDIQELMDIINPQHAILTGITAQHLETFYNLDSVIEEKHKILNVKGIKVAADSENVRKIDGVLYAGKNKDDYCVSETVEFGEDGSRFIMRIGENTLVLKTALLGEHNVLNLQLAAVMAYELGVTLGEIEDAIVNMKPCPHRLELIKSKNMKILDDTFNCNPVGAECAINVLSRFDGRKVVITPGMVELGAAEKTENYLLGRKIAAVADRVILIGVSRTKAIYEGLLSMKYNVDEIFVFETLEKAKNNFSLLLKDKDTVLMLNDLPDIY
ncbi:MAG: Mur ligase family protein [Christensenellales bacterium]